MLLIPADHYIDEKDKYLAVINKSFNYASHIATIVIRPTFPHTGSGSIKAKKRITDKVYKAGKFVEKPDLLQAHTYFAESDY